MKKYIKKILKPLVPKENILSRREKFNAREIQNWENNNKPLPPPHAVKQMVIQEFGERYKCSILVETGTFRGDMIEAQKYNFERLYSIELSQKLHSDAVRRFKGDSQVTILQGDSGNVMPRLIPELENTTLFWLDGHYSSGVTAKGEKNCPIYKELDAIFKSSTLNHVLLIDDARCFNGTEDYPTLEELKNYMNSIRPNYSFKVEDDLIRCAPQN